jgi:hypothetical protein
LDPFTAFRQTGHVLALLSHCCEEETKVQSVGSLRRKGLVQFSPQDTLYVASVYIQGVSGQGRGLCTVGRKFSGNTDAER